MASPRACRPFEELGAVVDEEMPALCPRDHHHAEVLRQLQSHVRDARARQQHRDTHVRRLHDDLGGEPAGGVEDLVVTDDAVQPHATGDGIGGVVAAYVLDEVEDVGILAERAAVHGAGLPVDVVEGRDGAQQVIDPRLPHARRLQTHVVDLVQRAGEHGALAAAGGDGAPAELFLPVADTAPGAGRHRDLLPVPVHLDGLDVIEILDQTLVAQIAQREQLGLAAQGHQRDDLAVVDLDGERELAGDLQIADLAVLVKRLHRVSGRQSRLAHAWQAGAHAQPPVTFMWRTICTS